MVAPGRARTLTLPFMTSGAVRRRSSHPCDERGCHGYAGWPGARVFLPPQRRRLLRPVHRRLPGWPLVRLRCLRAHPRPGSPPPGRTPRSSSVSLTPVQSRTPQKAVALIRDARMAASTKATNWAAEPLCEAACARAAIPARPPTVEVLETLAGYHKDSRPSRPPPCTCGRSPRSQGTGRFTAALIRVRQTGRRWAWSVALGRMSTRRP